jgi:hypothetical protein
MAPSNTVISHQTLAWFPLVERHRPSGLPLTTRITELRDLAAQPGTGDTHQQMIQAAEICNKAALIASDCGLPDLAHALCWSQHDIYDTARPLPAATAKLALQPLLNIPRQLIREGHGDTAHALLESLFLAARDRTNTVISGRTVNLTTLTSDPDAHRTICTLAWSALLADGTRALAQAGRWQQAAEQAAHHRGIGSRLLDGRQITILAKTLNGEPSQARDLVDQSPPSDPWEKPVQNLLRVLCGRAAETLPTEHVNTMLTTTLPLLQQTLPATAVFRTRVGLAALDLAEDHNNPQMPQLRAEIIATARTDAYAARDALTHSQLPHTMTARQREDLDQLVGAAGLKAGTIPPPLHRDLTRAVASAEQRLHTLLSRTATE